MMLHPFRTYEIHHALPVRRVHSLMDDMAETLDAVNSLVNAVADPAPYWVQARRHSANQETGVSEVLNTKEKFQVNLDVRHFKPEDLTVKCVGNRLLVTGKHEERQDDHGFISREFSRTYVLPASVNQEAIKSNLSPEMMLTIEAPKKAIEPPKEKSISINVEKAPEKKIEAKKGEDAKKIGTK